MVIVAKIWREHCKYAAIKSAQREIVEKLEPTVPGGTTEIIPANMRSEAAGASFGQS
jgi:hypothetical protein